MTAAINAITVHPNIFLFANKVFPLIKPPLVFSEHAFVVIVIT